MKFCLPNPKCLLFWQTVVIVLVVIFNFLTFPKGSSLGTISNCFLFNAPFHQLKEKSFDVLDNFALIYLLDGYHCRQKPFVAPTYITVCPYSLPVQVSFFSIPQYKIFWCTSFLNYHQTWFSSMEVLVSPWSYLLFVADFTY